MVEKNCYLERKRVIKFFDVPPSKMKLVQVYFGPLSFQSIALEYRDL